MTGSTGVARMALAIGLAMALPGCSEWVADQTAGAPPPGPSSAFDGRWQANIRATGSSTGIDSSECDAEPRLTLEVRGGRFTLTQHHRKLAAAAPTARDIATSTYHAEIAADGSITGMSDSNAALRGQVDAGRMSGNIYGLLCYYSFTAQRI